MDTIKTYLDNVFAAFPKTERVQALKRDMLAGMEEKYLTLRQQGNSEYEAVGMVIANFGSIDEIASELGIAPSPMPSHQGETAPDTEYHGNVIPMTFHEARSYVSKSTYYGYGLGFACVSIILGATLPMWAATNNLLSIILGAIGGFVLACLLVQMVIEFKAYQKANIRLSAEDHYDLSDLYARFAKRSIAKIAGIGVAVLTIVIFESVGHSSMPLILITISIGIILVTGTIASKAAYDYMLGKWKYKSGRWEYKI